MKCKNCGKEGHHYNQHHDGGYVCPDCEHIYYVCPDCGELFDKDDYENGDSGKGFCVKCAPKHD